MTNMEIVNRAESIVNDPEHIDHLSADDITMLSAALGIARIILREQEAKVVDFDQVKPLTLDELREMDGEPVFVIQPADGPLCLLPSFWGIVNVEEETVSGNLYCATFEDYDTEWLAYRHKP